MRFYRDGTRGSWVLGSARTLASNPSPSPKLGRDPAVAKTVEWGKTAHGYSTVGSHLEPRLGLQYLLPNPLSCSTP